MIRRLTCCSVAKLSTSIPPNRGVSETMPFLRFLGEGAPFNIIRDRSRRELRVDSGVRGTQHASRRGTPWGVKPVDNGPTSASHTADERATPAIYADDEEPA